MYGGAARGGKTYAALMAAAQYVDVPGYAALILRENFPDLEQPGGLIPESKGWWAGKARWHEQRHRWTFPSGAFIQFGHLNNDDAVYQYQGTSFQTIFVDELTQHTEFRYRYLYSRLVKPTDGPLSRVPLRMRSASNPGGKGHEWVKRRFVNPATREPGAVFVPAKVADNPAVDQPSYLKSLSYLDPVTRAQLLAGDWDAIADGRFKRAWLRHYDRHGTGYIVAGRIVTDGEVRDRFLTVDTAATVKETAKSDPDYTVVFAWGLAGPNLLCLDCWRDRVEVPDILPAVSRLYTRHRAGRVYFRSSGPEIGVYQAATRQTAPRLNAVNLPGKGDKLQKAVRLLNMAEAGHFWLPAPGAVPQFPLEDIEAELLRFTGNKDSGHDDIWDAAGIAGTVAEMGTYRPGGVPQFMG